MMTPAEVRREVAETVPLLFADQRLLRGILERHEAKIQKRWDKKTRTQRLSILLEAWPNMPATHRPDFAAVRKGATRVNGHQRDSFIWPYINQEDLAKARALLLLLNARGRNHPTVFAAADGEAMHLGTVSGVTMPIFLNEHVMILNGVTVEEEYGRLLNWEDHEDAFDWMHTRKQFLPGEGLMILEAQSRLLEFLVQCCRQILHDIPAGDLVGDAYPVQPEPQLKAPNDSTGLLTSLSVLAEEAPYRAPEKLDLDKIESLLAARKALAEDHAWALREDPGYFADCVFETRDHRQEMLKDVQGSVHPTLKPPRDGILWCRVIGSVVLEAQLQLELFSELHRQAQELRALQRRHAADISPLQELPEPYLAALLKFRHYLNQTAKGPMSQLKMTFVASPPMRSFFVRDVPVSVTSSQISVMSRPGVKMDAVANQLLWLLRTLWEDGRDLFLCRLPAVVDELDRLLKAEARARELVSPHTARIIGDLAIAGECLRQLDIYQPWANGFENALVDRREAIEREFSERTGHEARVLDALRDGKLAAIRHLGDPSDKKFEYPVGKRRTEANVDRLRAAEAHLDSFWAKADELVRTRAGWRDDSALQRLLSQPRLLQRTPRWIEPAVGTNGKAGRVATTGGDELSTPFSAVHLDPGPPSARSAVLAAGPTKPKEKTRGVPGSSSAPPGGAKLVQGRDAADAQRAEDAQPPFTADARALKVFRVLFFDASANTTPGEVGWNDFLHALQTTGFAAQKLYGSVWHFQPTGPGVERSIQFHEPHPRPKIPFLVARRYGRRLGRAYGWHAGMFLPRG
ncbi:hypothetical protein CDD83_4013 [Cordyceps sp. RAO-2017]|nr:hypothetical protein CDD83_4013 [Cordyceps sp. RAO-2017]